MKSGKKTKKAKAKLHFRNKHKERYDFEALVKSSPELKRHVILNKFDDKSIDFANPTAVKALNKALLLHFYKVNYWDVPNGFLCPPIPGRADYIHNIADLLSNGDENNIPTGKNITVLDIGTGANCVYPLIGTSEYDWNFIASDIDRGAVKWATGILDKNEHLSSKIDLRLQEEPNHIFKGILRPNETVDITMCNPPFHSSLKNAEAGTQRKLTNLKGKKVTEITKNFGGTNNELWCFGGEKRFIANMINESVTYKNNCKWFTSLVSDKDHLQALYKTLDAVNPTKVKTLPMGQGNKVSRILAWSFK